jgi:hypothetical protein
LETLTPDPALPSCPTTSHHLHLIRYVNASHGNDLRHCRSTTGYAFILAGGAIDYRSKMQTITATSLTEAKFIAAVSAAKVAKYLCCSILSRSLALLKLLPHRFMKTMNQPLKWSVPTNQPNIHDTVLSSTLPFRIGAKQDTSTSLILEVSSTQVMHSPKVLVGHCTHRMLVP